MPKTNEIDTSDTTTPNGIIPLHAPRGGCGGCIFGVFVVGYEIQACEECAANGRGFTMEVQDAGADGGGGLVPDDDGAVRFIQGALSMLEAIRIDLGADARPEAIIARLDFLR